jgi:lipid II:glycine glycyltransferase (peptidoglycan interpeptide bridge formation enzyme)
MKSFLQTTEWLEFQKSIGRKVWRFDDGKVVANIIQHDLPFGMNYLYIPHGPEILFEQISGGIKNELAQFTAYLKNLAREQKSIFIKIEPLDDKVPEVLHDFKFKKSAKEIQPHRSVVVDLNQSEEELLGAMHHKTRYNIKVAEKAGIKANPSDDAEAFLKLLGKTAKRDKFLPHEAGYYRKLLEFFSQDKNLKADLLLASHEGRPVAGAMILSAGDTCYYLHGASDYNYRAMMAPYALHWEIIKYLRAHNFKHYDFWGIDASKWPGITRFKLGWGGRQVEYPGSFDFSIRPFWFLIYKVLRKIF